ncbi:ankyrin repeat domain-containing protein 9-like [Hyperolius riggenbachi]|uniref:ankyrin repeat domain-containing protein 9-like n=1 Tax=Hyperolius riggenbachi TaxID=752182 RepID=UPI0035A2E9D8
MLHSPEVKGIQGYSLYSKRDQLFICIAYHLPVVMLELLRSRICYPFLPQVENWTQNPYTAFVFALKHNHVEYARYLLKHFPDDLLKDFGEVDIFKSVPYLLELTIYFDRREILIPILEALQSHPRYPTCLHVPFRYDLRYMDPYPRLEKKRTALHYACKYLRRNIIMILLRVGLSPEATNHHGETPMDIVLKKMCASQGRSRLQHYCLDNLLLYPLPKNFKMKNNLEANAPFWLGFLNENEYRYLLGTTPSPLAFLAMRKVLECLNSLRMLESIQNLPIPERIKPMSIVGEPESPLLSVSWPFPPIFQDLPVPKGEYVDDDDWHG